MLKVRLIAHTPEPEKVVAAAAKLCYANAAIDDLLDGLTEEKSCEFVQMLATIGHESPTEHASFTFAIEGVSRSLLAQITRHRLASFSVQSQRYVAMDEFDYVTPPEITGLDGGEALFDDAMRQQMAAYDKLVAMLCEKHESKFALEGVPKEEAAKLAQKKAIEDARFVLPNACATKMIVTMNARTLNHFFRLRCCNRAQWEIQALADEMLRLCLKTAPALFAKAGPGCVHGACSEGKMTCGKASEVREKYRVLFSEGSHG